MTMNVVEVLDKSAKLVKRWGAAPLSDGRAVSQHLSVGGVSLWDVAAVDLAVYLVPEALAGRWRRGSISRLLRSKAGNARGRLLQRIARSDRGCAQWHRDARFVLLGFSSYLYRDILGPVAKELRESMGHDAVVTIYDELNQAETAAVEVANGHSIWSHWTDAVATDLREIRAEYERVVLQWSGEIQQVVRDEDEDLRTDIVPLLEWLLQTYFRRLLPQIALARHILRAHAAQVIISPDVADPRTRLYSCLAPLSGLRAMTVVFGDVFGDECVEWRFFVGDRVTTAGNRVRDFVVKEGVPADSVCVTGSPRHDALVDVPAHEIEQLRRDLALPAGKTPVLFASTVSLPSYDGIRDRSRLQDVKRAVFEAVDRMPALHLIIKPHPLEDVRETGRLAAGLRHLQLVDRKLDIRRLTSLSEIFITLGSTSTLGALLQRKLVIWPAFEGALYWDDPFVASGAVLIARTPDELEWLLKQATGGNRDRLLDELEPARQRFLEACVFKSDGLSAARVASVAVELSGSKATLLPVEAEPPMTRPAVQTWLNGS